ncbi:MAG: NTPase [Candidatus Thorarchaeota archaeon]|nr:MAG: NTPase [Candidatus Thorarchaeota archaeon]
MTLMNILLTGRPGIGKTTVIRSVLEKLDMDAAGGFWSQEIRREGKRVGFSIVTLSGESGILAHVDLDRGPRVGRYIVNVADIRDIAIPSIAEARRDGKIIVIDEIAKMELCVPQFETEVVDCLSTGKTLGTVQMGGGKFVSEIKKRPDVTLVEITHSNRVAMPERILRMLST